MTVGPDQTDRANPLRAAWAQVIGPGHGPAQTEIGTGEVVPDAVGFPDAVVDEDLAHPELVAGRLLSAGGALSGLVPFDVDSSVPDDSKLWQGMSGAAVRDRERDRAGGRLCGVVVKVDKDRQQRRLYVGRCRTRPRT